jgi:phosphoadenosine phosphosulfate reductase
MTKLIAPIFTTEKNITRNLKHQIDSLNQNFQSLEYRQRLEKLYETFDTSEILVTSSFGTKSVFLLWLISQIQPEQKVHFINTTYQFPETLEYKKELTDLLGLEIIEVLPNAKENLISKSQELWKTDTERCCAINKILPLEPIKAGHKVWISGIMAYQTEFRKNLRVWEQQDDLLKFHPLIDIEEGEFLYQTDLHKLPQHPLMDLGYGSVGCTHCTVKGTGRSGRWANKEKTECGLHPEFFEGK